MRRLCPHIPTPVSITMLLMAIIAVCSCTTRPPHEPQFRRARAVMDSCPECALAILDSIHPADLRPGLDSARYILLHALAENKADILTTSDSAMQLAIDIFRQHQDIPDLRNACYLKGWILYINEDYDKALPELLEAESMIDSSTPPLEKGLIYHALADYCNAIMNGTSAIEYLSKAHEAYIEGHKYYHALFAKRDQAIYLNNSNQYKEAKKIFAILSDSAVLRKDTALLIQSYDGLCISETGMGNYKSALQYMGKYKELTDTLDEKTLGLWLYLEKKEGNAKEAEALAYVHLLQDNPWVTYALTSEDPLSEKLIGAYIKQNEDTNNEILITYTNNYATTLTANFRLRQESERYQLKLRRLYNIVLTAALLITLLGGCLGISYFRKRAKDQYQHAVCLSKDIKALLASHSLAVESMSEKCDRYDKSFHIRMEVLGRYTETLNQLVKSCNAKTHTWSVIGPRLTDISNSNIQTIRNDFDLQGEMETLADFRHDNIIRRFREELPDIKDSDILMMVLLVNGCTPLVISKVLDLSSVNYFGVRRQRLRDSIKTKNPPSLQDFLRFL